MNRDFTSIGGAPDVEILAWFGDAKLVKTLGGRLEIRGGNERERAEAQAWIEQFLRPHLLSR
jgi:hypothetical protein